MIDTKNTKIIFKEKIENLIIISTETMKKINERNQNVKNSLLIPIRKNKGDQKVN